MKQHTEELICNSILQNPIEITVLGKTYSVAQPTTATIIFASKYISRIPKIEIDSNDNAVLSILRNAKDCEHIGYAIAILILGKKNLVGRKFFGLKKVDNVTILARQLLENCSPKELQELLTKLLKMLELGFFLDTIIFLQDVNLLKKTKANEATASGQPLEQSPTNIN